YQTTYEKQDQKLKPKGVRIDLTQQDDFY
ncbi:MAG: hypothetical protein ACI9BD_000163, partial [Candidatus Marinamargulisbacteria bacterium]